MMKRLSHIGALLLLVPLASGCGVLKGATHAPPGTWKGARTVAVDTLHEAGSARSLRLPAPYGEVPVAAVSEQQVSQQLERFFASYEEGRTDDYLRALA